MEDLRNQLGNVEFVDGGKGSTGSRSRDKRETAEDSESRLKRSTSQDKYALIALFAPSLRIGKRMRLNLMQSVKKEKCETGLNGETTTRTCEPFVLTCSYSK